MWLKFLYFLRIFRGTGYLISMIIQVMSDMRVFLSIFLITQFSFGHCFYILSLNNLIEDQFTISFIDSVFYSYRMALGDFDTTKFGSVDVYIVWTVFLIATIFLQIVMLNLLIAIISDTFAKVQE